MQRYYKINFRNLLLILFTSNCFFLQEVKGQNADINMLKSITAHRNLTYQEFQRGLSFSVYPTIILVPSSLVCLNYIQHDSLTYNTGLCVAAGIALNSVMALGAKYAINRERPYIHYPEINPIAYEKTPSMPSGHTSSAFNVATSLTLFYPKWYVAIPAYTWASGVAYSRMYIGVHYPSDIIVGALLGSGTSWLTYYLNKKWFRKKK